MGYKIAIEILYALLKLIWQERNMGRYDGYGYGRTFKLNLEKSLAERKYKKTLYYWVDIGKINPVDYFASLSKLKNNGI